MKFKINQKKSMLTIDLLLIYLFVDPLAHLFSWLSSCTHKTFDPLREWISINGTRNAVWKPLFEPDNRASERKIAKTKRKKFFFGVAKNSEFWITSKNCWSPFLYRRQSYKIIFVLKKTILDLNFLMLCYFNKD